MQKILPSGYHSKSHDIRLNNFHPESSEKIYPELGPANGAQEGTVWSQNFELADSNKEGRVPLSGRTNPSGPVHSFSGSDLPSTSIVP